MTVPTRWQSRLAVALRDLPADRGPAHEAGVIADALAELCPGHRLRVSLDGHLSTGVTAGTAGSNDEPPLHTLPLVVGHRTAGRVDVVAVGVSALDADVLLVAVTSAGRLLTGERLMRTAQNLARGLHDAVGLRTVFDQAAGVLAGYGSVPPPVAAHALRRHARRRGLQLRDVCAAVVDGSVSPSDIALDHPAIGVARRQSLREAAVMRWHATMADSERRWTAAQAAVGRSVELRVAFDNQRAEQELARRRRERPRTAVGASRPTVLVGEDRPRVRAFVLSVLARDERISVIGATVTGDAALALGIVEQPDLMIVGPHMLGLPGSLLTDELRRYCPDSRSLVVVDPLDVDQDADVVPSGWRALRETRPGQIVVRRGDEATLQRRVGELCGVGAR